MARTPGQRAGLTRAAVLAAARELLAERGLDGLTMRALAQRMSVAPNALYSHVASKPALVDELLDDTLSEVQTPVREGDPEAGLRAVMASTYDVLLAHADLVPLYLARQGSRGPHAQALGDLMLGLLASAGIEGPPAREALRVLIVHTVGFAAFSTQPPVGDEERPLSPAELRASFSRSLDWLLAGILGDARHPQPAR